MQFKLRLRRTKLLSIVLILLLFNLAIMYFLLNDNSSVISPLDNNNSNFINLPKTSDNEITIETPENKTYSESMSGYYLATYGFENDIVNTFPYGWIDNDVSTCETKVIGYLDGHNDIVQQYDNHGSAAAQMNKDIPATSIITVEFWVRTDLLVFVYFNVQDSLMTDNTFDLNTLSGFSVNTWHHIRFNINTVTDKYDSYLDGVLKDNQANLPSPMNDVDQIQFNTSPSQINYNIWWDAIGGNWDPNYNVGDNLKEGLLLSYENSTKLDWMGYSLDGGANKTIVGNTTIPLPIDGRHNIQIFGNNSFGAKYQSMLRYFSVYHLALDTPENKTYTEPMSGYFPATYGFENDVLGSFPYGWIDNDVSTCETRVIGYLDGHNNIVEQFDNQGSAAAQMNKDIPATSIVSIEFWVRTDLLVFVYFNVQDSLMTDNTFDLNTLSGFSVNTWHHIRFNINTVTDKYDSYLDGVLKDNQTTIPYPMMDVANIQFNTAPSQIYHIWWDAIGGNWDPNYNIGDNLKEGLLLSYENSTNLDWMGYSLDGGANKTIVGNTTIPLPIDGRHNIQVFGNDTMSNMYLSKIRRFSVDTLGPSITINTPYQNQYFNSVAPNYDVSIIDWNLHSMWYSLDNGNTNLTLPGLTGTIDQNEWNKELDGPVTLRFYANDTLGHINTAEVLIEKDTTSPSLTINNPKQNDVYGSITPNFDITIVENNLNSSWYTIDNGLTNITFSGLIGTINQTEWDKVLDGLVTIKFYVNDSAGNINSTQVIIEKDTIIPFLSINSPNTNEYFALLAPDYDLSITDLNLDSTWYTIDNGLTNISFTGLIGTIDQTEWGKITDGLLTVRYYANDTVGNINYIEINIYKDTTIPIITINSPMIGEEFYEIPPEFNLTIDELNLDSAWYTIDGGLTTFIFTEMTGFIDSTAWNEASIGAITLRFYARDMAGNEVYQEVVVLKRTSEVPPEIPGFNLPILFIMMGVISISSIKIKKNKIK